MVEDNPNMQELEQLMDFCSKHKKIYIYGHDLSQKLISKYLAMSGKPITGFIVPEVFASEMKDEPFPIINLFSLPRIRRNVGVILSVEEWRNNEILYQLHKAGIKNIFMMSEWNKRTIPFKMMPRSVENFYLEVNLADHCNLNCQCCDHFSPLADSVFLDYEQYVKDIHRLSKLTGGKIGLMKLQGGEPLLNDRVCDYMKVTREVFPDSHICLFTDGLLLAAWDNEKSNSFWQCVKENEVEVRITRYPIPYKIEKVINKCNEFNIDFTTTPPPFVKGARVWYFSEIGAVNYTGEKHSVKHPFDLNGQQEPFRFISCYQFNESIVLRDGKIYTCPMIPYVHYFNKAFSQNLTVTDEDYIDIYKADSFQEIAEFCTHRVPFCKYCAVHKRTVRTWKQSDHNIEEWTL